DDVPRSAVSLGLQVGADGGDVDRSVAGCAQSVGPGACQAVQLGMGALCACPGLDRYHTVGLDISDHQFPARQPSDAARPDAELVAPGLGAGFAYASDRLAPDVDEPERAVAPAWLLGEPEAADQHMLFGHGRHARCSWSPSPLSRKAVAT